MNKPLFATLVGGFLGIFDGLTAPLSAPETAPELLQIVIGSVIKGFITGVLIGWISQRFRSLPVGIVCGLVIGAALSFLVALLQYLGQGRVYFWQIMLPGAVLGVVVGFVTQKYGRAAAPQAPPRVPVEGNR